MLRGEGRDGPEAVLHAAFAFGAAGISVGPDIGGTFGNAALLGLLDVVASDGAVPGADAAIARHPTRGGGGGDARRVVAEASRTSGQPLPESVRADMEARFGERFDDVRVHTDGVAARAAEAVSARAYTVGNQIWFGQGELRPHDPAGRELLAHELTHVLQNRAGNAPSGGGEEVDGVRVSSPSDAREREAVATAREVSRSEIPASPADGFAGGSLEFPSAVTARLEHAFGPGLLGGESTTGLDTEAFSFGANALFGLSRAQVPEDGGRSGDDPKNGALTAAQEALLEEIRARLGGVKRPEVKTPAATPGAPAVTEEETPVEQAPTPVVPTAEIVEGGGSTTSPDAGADSGAPEAGMCTFEGARPLDGLVDHYMATHWDESELTTKTQEFGVYPDAISTEIDRWLPSDVTAEGRSAANFIGGLFGGLLDSFYLSFASSVPGFGLVYQAIGGLKDIFDDAGAYLEVGDPLGATLITVRHGLATVGGIAGNFGDLCTAVQDTAHVLAPVVGGISEIVGVPVAALGTGAQTVAAFCDEVLTGLDVFMLVYDLVCANDAEIQGNFERAAFYRDMARGDVVNVISSVIKALLATASAATAAVVPGGAPTNFAEMMRETGQDFLDSIGGLKGNSLDETFGNVVDTATDPADEILGLFDGANNFFAATGFGDAMARTDDGFMGGHYITRAQLSAAGTDAASMIGAARTATLAQLEADWASIEGEDPLWHQAVINTILEPDGGIWFLEQLADPTSPSQWIELHFSRMRWVLTMIGDAGYSGVAFVADTVEAMTSGVAQPLIENLNAWIAENKPALDEWLIELNDKLQAQEVSLESLRTMLTNAQSMIDTLGGWVGDADALDAVIDPMIAAVEGFQITAELLGIPDWVPPELYQGAIAAINSTLADALAQSKRLKEEVEANVKEKVAEMLAWAEAKLAEIQEALAEGGEVETVMNEELTRVKDLVKAGTEAFVAWDGVLDLDFRAAADWLRHLAESARESTSEGRQGLWVDFIRNEAQTYVDGWKDRHADEVKMTYFPEVPEAEIAAVEAAYTLLVENYDRVRGDPSHPDRELAEYRLAELEEAYAEAMATSGGQGREPLLALWRAEERIARLATIPLEEEPR